MDQTKTITIVGLEPKPIIKKDGTPSALYKIKGNDGVTYQTWDQPFYSQRQIGETIDITFYTTTFQGQKGLITQHNLVIDPAKQYVSNQQPAVMPSRENPGVNANVAAMIAEIKRAEINIIAAIRVHCGTNIAGIERKETIPIIEENEQKGYSVKVEEKEEEIDTSDNNPF